jgi:uncharacterized repeat protein (TIGR03847 family)
MNRSFDFDPATFFTVGAIGEPGNRLFILQAANATDLVSLKVEKQQVASLCRYLGEIVLLAQRPGHLPEDLALRGVPDVTWSVGSISATYDDVVDSITLAVEQVEDEVEDVACTGRIVLSREQAAAVAIHGTALIASGRPACPLCGYPIDPIGHACPRTNGNRPPQL